MADIVFDIRQVWILEQQPVVVEVSGPAVQHQTTCTADSTDSYGFSIDLGRSTTASTLILMSGQFQPQTIIIPIEETKNTGLRCELRNSSGANIQSGILLFAGVQLLDTAPPLRNGQSTFFTI